MLAAEAAEASIPEASMWPESKLVERFLIDSRSTECWLMEGLSIERSLN